MDPARDRVRAKLDDVLADRVDLSGRVERAIFNWTIATCQRRRVSRHWRNPSFRYVYTHKALSVLFNLKNPKTPHILRHLLDGTLTPHDLANAHPSTLHPDLWEPIYERIAYKKLRRELTIDVDAIPEGMHQCRCGSRKTTYTQLQTRSADEPMTTFVHCFDCGKRWKF